MVRLDRIATGGGDRGETALGNGSRVHKEDLRVAAYGTVDEANAALGLVTCEDLPEDIAAELRRICNDCFDLGSDLATPAGGPHEDKIPRIDAAQVARLDAAIDAANARLEPLRSFVLPGGTRAAALLHLARAIVRRAERDAWALARRGDEVNPHALVYLNRLSDLCFVWSRRCNDDGRADVLWEPGANRGDGEEGGVDRAPSS